MKPAATWPPLWHAPPRKAIPAGLDRMNRIVQDLQDGEGRVASPRRPESGRRISNGFYHREHRDRRGGYRQNLQDGRDGGGDGSLLRMGRLPARGGKDANGISDLTHRP